MAGKSSSTNNDPRKQRTRQLLQDALISLMKEMSIDKITVNDLIHRAGLSRSTFYLHYIDKQDFIDQVTSNLLNTFSENAKEYNSLPHKERIQKRGIFFFEYIAQNRDIYEALLGENGLPQFVEQWNNLGMEYFYDRYYSTVVDANSKSKDDLAIQFMLVSNYVVSAKLGLVKYWFQSGMKLSPSIMAEISNRCQKALLKEILNITIDD